MKRILFLAPVLFLVGCLKTRSDVKETEQRQVIQQQVVTLQKTNADAVNRFGEYDEEMRSLRGRMEVIENKLNLGQNESESAKKTIADQSIDTNRKFSLLQETITKMDIQIQQLSAELAALKAERAAGHTAAAVHSATASRKNNIEAADEYFAQKDWKKAILTYQKYRDENPKGKSLPKATYRIAVCFQELGMTEEAKTFYDEVLAKYPNSEEAKKTKVQLKSRKK